MKLDLFKKEWLDIVFEGRNKSYGAYDLRRNSVSTSIRAFIIGAIIFSIAVATPKIAEFIGNVTANDDVALDKKITTVKLPPKEEKPKENLQQPPPPPPKVDQVKFVKPVVAKTEEITEEPPKNEEIKDKKIGDENIKGDPNASLQLEEPGDGPPVQQQVVEEDNTIYNSAGIEVKPEFPGGIDKFYSYVASNFDQPEDDNFPGGRVIVSFVVEKDGSLTDIKVRDIGYGTKAAAEKVLRNSKRWVPAEQNGKKVRCSYTLPILLQGNSE
jgi:protein TonB